MSEVDDGTNVEKYEYNDRGVRVVKETGSLRTYYLIDAQNPTGYAQVIEELSSSGLERSYVIGHDVLSQHDSATNSAYLIYDGHGSTRQLLDATGAVITSPTAQIYSYDAYGIPIGFTLAAALTTLLYSGEQTDSTGLQYLRARYYNPYAGVFNRLDPFSGNMNDPQSLHKYLYTHANPVMGMDPAGLSFSMSNAMAVTIGIGKVMAYGTIAGQILGGINAVYGVATGRANAWDAYMSFLRYSSKGTVAGGLAGMWLLLPVTWKVLALAIPASCLSTGYYLTTHNSDSSGGDLLAALPWLPFFRSPSSWIKSLKTEITSQQQVPPELLASVLLAELMHYHIGDSLFDEEMITGEYHSMGIAQLRVDNMRLWGISRAGTSEPEIRSNLMKPKKAVYILSDVLKYFARNGSPSLPGPIDLSGWDGMTQETKELWAYRFTAAKDTGAVEYGKTTGFGLYGELALRMIQEGKLLE